MKTLSATLISALALFAMTPALSAQATNSNTVLVERNVTTSFVLCNGNTVVLTGDLHYRDMANVNGNTEVYTYSLNWVNMKGVVLIKDTVDPDARYVGVIVSPVHLAFTKNTVSIASVYQVRLIGQGPLSNEVFTVHSTFTVVNGVIKQERLEVKDSCDAPPMA